MTLCYLGKEKGGRAPRPGRLASRGRRAEGRCPATEACDRGTSVDFQARFHRVRHFPPASSIRFVITGPGRPCGKIARMTTTTTTQRTPASRRVATLPIFPSRRSTALFLFWILLPREFSRAKTFRFRSLSSPIFSPRSSGGCMKVEDKQKCERKRKQIVDRDTKRRRRSCAYKRRHIISVHMHEVDRSIHPSVSQSKAIDERTQPGDRGMGSEPMGEDELTEPKTQRQVVLNVIGKVSAWTVRSPHLPGKKKQVRGKNTIDIFSRAIFDYVESRFTVSQFCSKETSATFTNGSYFSQYGISPSRRRFNRLDSQ